MINVLALLTLFASGLFLWEGMDIGWENQRWILFIHVPLALSLMGYYTVTYIIPHVRYHLIAKKKKGKSLKRTTGIVLGLAILVSIVSGLWLMLIGQRGELIGKIAQIAHLSSSFVMVFLLLLHSTRFKLSKGGQLSALIVLLISLTPPLHAQGDNFAYVRGEKLFNSTEASDIEGLRMGNGKQSCASCHKGGFNESNHLLFTAAKIDPKKSAVIGHKNLKNFFAKNFVEDYVSAIIEQGGSVKNPQKPSGAILQAMGDLHLFIRSKSNLPFFSTWVRLDENITHYHPKEWLNSASCKSCHPDIFNQWANSNHRLMGGSNPYYSVMEDLAAKEEGEGIRFWCMGCHSPGVLTSGGRRTSRTSHLFDKNGSTLVEMLNQTTNEPEEGTSCLFCHRITKLEEVRGNGGYTLNLRDRPQYLFEDRKGLLGSTHDSMINAKPKRHAQSYSKPFYKDSKYCMSCHDEFAPGSGVKIVDTYGEWEKSPYNKGANNPKTKGCIDCHMNAAPANLEEKISGYSTVGGKLKESVKTHHFAGSNHFLSALRSTEHEKMTLDLLKSAAAIDIKFSKKWLVVRVINVGAGHHLPTGVADFRELWLEVTLKDATGKIILSSGMIDETGEIEKDARLFRKVFGDRNGIPVGLKFWKYEKLLADTRIPAKGFRDELYPLPANITYPVVAEVKLRFRIYPQWVTRAVQKERPELPTPPAVTLRRVIKIGKQP